MHTMWITLYCLKNFKNAVKIRFSIYKTDLSTFFAQKRCLNWQYYVIKICKPRKTAYLSHFLKWKYYLKSVDNYVDNVDNLPLNHILRSFLR